jgi:predicted small lipoprotein YifL
MPIRTMLIILLAAAILAGCGRRGSLEAPGAVATEQSAVPLAPDGISPLDPGSNAFGAEDEPLPTSPPQRRFLLDFLL